MKTMPVANAGSQLKSRSNELGEALGIHDLRFGKRELLMVYRVQHHADINDIIHKLQLRMEN